jgi:hypothetical protein
MKLKLETISIEELKEKGIPYLLDIIRSGAYPREATEAFVKFLVKEGKLKETNIGEFINDSSKLVKLGTPIFFSKKSWTPKYLYSLYCAASTSDSDAILLHFDEVVRHLNKKEKQKEIAQTIAINIPFIILTLAFVWAGIRGSGRGVGGESDGGEDGGDSPTE